MRVEDFIEYLENNFFAEQDVKFIDSSNETVSIEKENIAFVGTKTNDYCLICEDN